MIEELRKLEEEGLITLRPHDELPLLIANYTPEVQYERLWNEHPLITQCRGLIIDEDGQVIARPFPKFFNYEEHLEFDSLPDIPNEPFRVYEKMDGSLGIVFHYQGKWRVATRGSFHSDQAEKAQEMLNHYGTKYLPWGHTYLVEIIYPENRIVVNYGEDEKLVLLAVIHNSTGEEKDVHDFQFTFHEVVKEYTGVKDVESLTEVEEENKEGFVIHFESGLRMKVKLEEYVRLHRLLTGLTKRTIWELLKDGEDIEKIYDTAPDEVYEWVEETVNEIQTQYNEIELASKMIFAGVYCRLATMVELSPKHMPDEEKVEKYEAEKRKEFAKIVTSNENIKKEGLTPMMFRMYDGKKIDDLIWKNIKPSHEPIEATYE